jgi:hypothetical protein
MFFLVLNRVVDTLRVLKLLDKSQSYFLVRFDSYILSFTLLALGPTLWCRFIGLSVSMHHPSLSRSKFHLSTRNLCNNTINWTPSYTTSISNPLPNPVNKKCRTSFFIEFSKVKWVFFSHFFPISRSHIRNILP